MAKPRRIGLPSKTVKNMERKASPFGKRRRKKK